MEQVQARRARQQAAAEALRASSPPQPKPPKEATLADKALVRDFSFLRKLGAQSHPAPPRTARVDGADGDGLYRTCCNTQGKCVCGKGKAVA